LRDPEFLDDAHKLGLDVNLIPGPAVERLIDELYRAPEDVIAKVRTLIASQQRGNGVAPDRFRVV
jgi:hypothetical protein